MHAACSIGEDRRADVCLPARRVRLEIEERRTAFFGTLEERAASASEDVSSREERTRISRLRSHIPKITRLKFHRQKGLFTAWPQDNAGKVGAFEAGSPWRWIM
jgi:hypothetical protein